MIKMIIFFGKTILSSNKIKKESWGIFSTTFGFTLSIATLIENIGMYSILISLGVAFFSVLLFLNIKYNYYENHGKIIERGTTTIIVKFGDIFKEKGLKLIPCEGNFEKGDSNVISKESLQWRYLNKFKKDGEIKLAENCDSSQYFDYVEIIKEHDICFFSIIDLDSQNIAKCSTEEYVNIIFKLCKLIEQVAKKREVVIPIVGSGFKKTDRDMDSIDCLNLIITILKLYSFNRQTSIKIVIYNKKHSMKDINLFLLE